MTHTNIEDAQTDMDGFILFRYLDANDLSINKDVNFRDDRGLTVTKSCEAMQIEYEFTNISECKSYKELLGLIAGTIALDKCGINPMEFGIMVLKNVVHNIEERAKIDRYNEAKKQHEYYSNVLDFLLEEKPRSGRKLIDKVRSKIHELEGK